MQHDGGEKPDRLFWVQIAILATIRLVFNTAHRMVYPYLRVFAAGLGVDLNTMALAMSARAASGMLGPFLATIADSRGRRTGMFLGLGLFVAGLLAPLILPVFPAFVLFLILTTIGYTVFIPTMQAYLGDRVPYRQRGRVLGLTELSWSLSFIVGIPLVQVLIVRWGWRGPLPLLALLGMAGLFSILWIKPSDSSQRSVGEVWWKNFGKLLSSPLALVGLGMGLTIGLSNEVVNLIFGVWLEEAQRFTLGMLAQVAVGIGVMELAGELLSTLLADRAGKVKTTGIGLLLGSLAALGLALLALTPALALVSLLLFYLAFELTVVSSLSLMSEVLPEARATVMAMNISLISLGRAVGAWAAPGLYTWGKAVFPDLGLTTLGANALLAAGLNLVALGLVLRLKVVEKS